MLNPNAPEELSQFAFVIGKWKGEGKVMTKDGTMAAYQTTWVGRYILDGYAIANESKIHDKNAGWEALWTTFFIYDKTRGQWIIEALNTLDSTFNVQVSGSSGGVQLGGSSITVASQQPGYMIREHYLNMSEQHYTFSSDVSTDNGKTWINEVDVIEISRVAEQ